MINTQDVFMKKYIILFIFNLIMCNCLNAQYQFNIRPTNGPYGGYIRSFCYDSSNKDIYGWFQKPLFYTVAFLKRKF